LILSLILFQSRVQVFNLQLSQTIEIN